MFHLYEITSKNSDKVYYGMTNNIRNRKNTHKYAAKYGKSPLYSWMRKHTDWELTVIASFFDKESCCEAEQNIIKFGNNVLNIHPGGEGGFDIRNLSKERYEEAINKLKEARKGKTPALGMKHSEDNKKLFGEYGKLRWDIHGRYPKEVIELPFKEAKEKYGISKTHYYRLKKCQKSTNLVIN